MLNLMRKHARNWLMKVLLIIIIIVFIFYFGATSGRQKAETVAVVGDKSISFVDLQKEYDNMVEAVRQKTGGNLPPEVLKGLNLKQTALDNLVNEEIIMQQAAALDIVATDAEVKQAILSYPAFQRNGTFDERLYRQTLQANRLSPEIFEAAQKRTITAAKLAYLIQDGAKVSDEEAYDLYRLQNEQLNISFLQFPAAAFRAKVNPAASDLEAFLKEKSAEFRVPEQVRISYLSFSADDYAATAKATDEDIREYYERNKERWTKGGKTAPLAEVRDKIIAELRQASALRKAEEEAKKAHDIIYQEENFDAYAAKNRVKLHTTDFFTAKNPPPEFRQIGDFAGRVFTLKVNELGDVLKGETAYYVVKLIARKAAYTPSLKEIAPEVERRYREQQAVRLAGQAASAALERLKKGESLEKLAGEKGFPVQETGFFLPGGAVPKLGSSPALNAAILQVSEKSPYPEQALETGDSFVIIRLKERKKTDRSGFAAKKAALQYALREMDKNEMMKSWLDGTKAAMLKKGTLKLSQDLKDKDL